MERTQIYLSRKQKRMLQKEARRKNTTLSDVVRGAVDSVLIQKTKKRTNKKEPLAELVRRVRSKGFAGPKDLAQHLDDYLYGGKE